MKKENRIKKWKELTKEELKSIFETYLSIPQIKEKSTWIDTTNKWKLYSNNY